MRSRACVCGGLNAETTGLNPTEDMGVHLLCLSCVVKVMAWPLIQADHSFRGVLQYMCVCVCMCLIMCHLETSKMRQPRHNLGLAWHKKKNNNNDNTALQQSNDKHHTKSEYVFTSVHLNRNLNITVCVFLLPVALRSPIS
jgi:hypothetical protein